MALKQSKKKDETRRIRKSQIASRRFGPKDQIIIEIKSLYLPTTNSKKHGTSCPCCDASDHNVDKPCKLPRSHVSNNKRGYHFLFSRCSHSIAEWFLVHKTKEPTMAYATSKSVLVSCNFRVLAQDSVRLATNSFLISAKQATTYLCSCSVGNNNIHSSQRSSADCLNTDNRSKILNDDFEPSEAIRIHTMACVNMWKTVGAASRVANSIAARWTGLDVSTLWHIFDEASLCVERFLRDWKTNRDVSLLLARFHFAMRVSKMALQ